MDDNVKKLDTLLSMKKKEPNQEEKKQYYTSFFQLLNTNGFDEEVQKYMGKGFQFIRMAPFRVYFSRLASNEKLLLLKRLFESKHCLKENSRAVNILVNLLALFISNGVEPEYCRIILNKLPEHCYTKKGELLGNLNGSMLNYFYADLSKIPAGLKYEELFDDEKSRLLFDKLIIDSLEYASTRKELSSKQNEGIELVRQWVPAAFGQVNSTESREQLSQAPAEGTSTDLVSIKEGPLQREARKTDDDTDNTGTVQESAGVEKQTENGPVKTSADVDKSDNDENNESKKDTSGTAVPDNASLVFLINIFDKLNKLGESIENNNHNTSILLRENQGHIASLAKELERERENSDQFRQRNIELLSENRELRKKIEEIQEQLRQKTDEADGLRAMVDVSVKEAKRNISERTLRAVEELRYEYQDYLPVRNHEMSIELGENMRGQLEAVFNILREAGFDLDSR